MTKFETLDYRIEDGVAVITFTRPDQMNTFTAGVMRDMLDVFDETDGNDKVRAVVVTGSGRAFCAGADLGKGGETFNFDAKDTINGVRRDGGGRVVLRIYRSLKPVIAAVNGAAVGVGATMQLPMDARLAATNARFGFVFARRGITPEACSSFFLPRLVGVPTTLDWCYSGRVFTAQEALERGLVQSLHEPDALLSNAITYARTLTEHSAPVSVALTRQLIWQSLGASHPMDVHRIDSRALQSRGKSADVKEGIGAFLEKRPAAFPDTVLADMPDFYPWRDEPEFE